MFFSADCLATAHHTPGAPEAACSQCSQGLKHPPTRTCFPQNAGPKHLEKYTESSHIPTGAHTLGWGHLLEACFHLLGMAEGSEMSPSNSHSGKGKARPQEHKALTLFFD